MPMLPTQNADWSRSFHCVIHVNQLVIPKMAGGGENALTIRDFSKVILTLDNVLISEDKLSPTPSMVDGLDYERELDLRIQGCELIQTAGILLKLPQVLKLWFFSSILVSYDDFIE